MKQLKRKLYLLVVGLLLVGGTLLPVDFAHTETLATTASSVATRQYGNVLIKWEPNLTDIPLTVTITMGAALIEVMHFTPDTLQHTLNYSNPPQSATGSFIVEFNASGKGGKLYCADFIWKTMSGAGNITSFIGTW